MRNLIQIRNGGVFLIAGLALSTMVSCSSGNGGSGMADTFGKDAVSSPVTNNQEETAEVKQLRENQDKLNLLIAGGEITKCNDLDLNQFRDSCEANILVSRAKTNKDLTVCKEASTAEIKTQCERLVAKKTF